MLTGLGLATGPLMGEAIDAVQPQRSGTAAALINVALMVGAMTGADGLRLAMLAGGLIQIGGGAYAWRRLRGRVRNPAPDGRVKVSRW